MKRKLVFLNLIKIYLALPLLSFLSFANLVFSLATLSANAFFLASSFAFIPRNLAALAALVAFFLISANFFCFSAIFTASAFIAAFLLAVALAILFFSAC